MGTRYEPKEHILPLDASPRVESIIDQREITVQTYQTNIAYDHAAIDAGLEGAWLRPQVRFGVFARVHVAGSTEHHVVLGLQDDLTVRAYDYDERRPLWFAWKNVVVDTVSIRYFRNDEGLLRYTTTGGGQRITEERLQEFNASFLGIPKDASSKLQFDLAKLRDLCFNRFAERLFMLRFKNPSAVEYHSIDLATFKSRKYIDQRAERFEEIRNDPKVTIDSFDSDVAVKADLLATPATVRFEIRGLSGSLRLRFPKMTFKAQPKTVEEEASVFYQVVDTAVRSILDSDYYAQQLHSLDDLDLDLGMFPDLVDLTPFREVLIREDARAKFFSALDLGAHWQNWLPHLRALDELLPADAVKSHVAGLLADLARRDPVQAKRLLIACQRDSKLCRVGALAALALHAEVQAVAAEHRAGVEEALLNWSLEHDSEAWDVEPDTGIISIGNLRWRVEDLALDILPAVIWKLVGLLHARLTAANDDAAPLLAKYHWCMAAAKELPPTHCKSNAALRLVSAGRVPTRPADSGRVLRSRAPDLSALDDAMLDQFGLPLWPHLTARRRKDDVEVSNDGVGGALAITLRSQGAGKDSQRPVDLPAGESLLLPGNGRADAISLTFEKYGRASRATIPVKSDGVSHDLPDNVRRLPAVISRKRIDAQRLHRAAIDPNGVVVGSSPCVLQMFEAIHHANAMNGGAAVLLLGERGVGKTHIAKLLHDSSSRSSRPYKEVNAGLTGGDPNMQRGEWIGYSKNHGAQSVDPRGKHGHITEVDKGTLFVDEFVTLSNELQMAFLSVLEGRGVQQVGGATVTPDVRCVFATNADVDAAAEKGQLRFDLLDRIPLRILVPALRDHRGDIAMLAKHFAGDGVKLDDACLLALLQYDWPGNIRELQLKVQSAVARAEGEETTTLKLEHFDLPSTFLSGLPAVDGADLHRELWALADGLARAEGFEPGAGLQRRAGEILGVGDAQASKMYANYGLAQANVG